MSSGAIERQVIVTWYTPEEKLPAEGITVVASISGRWENVTYDHAFALVEWFNDGLGFTMSEVPERKGFTVHAWCDLEPYGSQERVKEYFGGAT